jgi:hypothetical protein
MVRMVAFLETDAGAADMALATGERAVVWAALGELPGDAD